MAAETEPLTISVETPESWTKQLSITVPAARVNRTRRSIATQVSERARLPGFRKGKLPPRVLEQRFGPAIEQETVDRTIQEAFREAVQQESLSPITEGQVDDVDYEKQADLRFKVRFEVRPDPALDRVSGFTVSRPSAEIGDDDVDSVLERMRDEQATWHPLPESGKPDYEDRVRVEITQLDEEDGSDPEPRAYRFVIGEGQAIPEVEEAIMSLDPGQEGEFRPHFPDDFPDEERRDKEQHLRIRLEEAHRKELPALDDDLARTVGDFDTLDELRRHTREELEREAVERAEAEVRDRLVEQIAEANGVDVPQSMLERYLNHVITGGRDTPEHRPPEEEERLMQASQALRPGAERSLRRMMIVEKLAEREDLRATPDDVDERVETMAAEHGRDPGEIWVELERSGRLQAIENEITEDRVFEYLKSQNTVT